MDELTQKDTVASGQSKVGSVAGNGRRRGSHVTDDIRAKLIPSDVAEDLVGEDAKLGKSAARVSTRSSGDTSHTTRPKYRPKSRSRRLLSTVQRLLRSRT